MSMTVKFQVKVTVTPEKEKEMKELLEMISRTYEGEMEAFDKLFYIEYHFKTTWQNYQAVSKIIDSQPNQHYISLVSD